MAESDDISLRDILDVVKAQCDSLRNLDCKLSTELIELKQEVHGSSQVACKHDILELPEALVAKVHLVTDLIAQCRSTNTIKGYYRAFMRWKSWASSNGISTEEILPAKAFHVSLYLSCLVQQCSSPSPVVTAFYRIKWAHNMISVQSPTDSILVRNVLEGAKRRLSVPVCKKEPITPDLLDKMFNSLFVEGNLYNQRIISACLLSYSGFLRASELLHLKLGDVEFFTTHMRIFIEQSKTDVYRDGNWLVISRCDSKLCPVLNLDRYISYAKISDFDTFLFQNVTKCEHGYKFRQGNKPMSYSRMRELFIEAFKPFVSDIRSYGLHSLRSGGASAAANHGIPDRLFKRHGRWRSENAKDGYIKDSLDDRLAVSKHLGL
ncbi:hypothetical protein FSP39_022401 [Pinctada imbricata]|uniref:Tyr recombinase domain-containing protein n=1 Tax=Pinctada imbricata TaxID=66713 RepID=A0AA88YPB6_PINIB|nr:hypothetical protein FSP39_022401 [Pinctada imbricata]